MTLSTKFKQHLKAKAHSLKPVILVGSNGVTDAVIQETDHALKAHELIKVKIATNDRELKKQLFSDMCDKLSAELIQIIGNIGIIYRKNED